ncbi:hypothetical protein QQP08_002165 [Theobroma cacao]|nr:hypothetical protein QQP08_002165 [Theobroma cacao]
MIGRPSFGKNWSLGQSQTSNPSRKTRSWSPLDRNLRLGRLWTRRWTRVRGIVESSGKEVISISKSPTFKSLRDLQTPGAETSSPTSTFFQMLESLRMEKAHQNKT